MKKILVSFLILLCSQCFAQEDAWVYFTDKPDAAYYFANPLEMLTQRALDRRSAQGIALDIRDVPIASAYLSGVTSSQGITVMARSKWMNAVHVRGTVADINLLTQLPYVSSIDFADASLDTGKGVRPVITKPTQRVATALASYNYGSSSTQITMLNGQTLHQQDYTGAGKVIAVMDNGFPGVNTTQPLQRLNDNNLILGGYNYVSGNTDVYTGGNHGTMVLSSMAGYLEGQLVGTAPDAHYYLFVTEDTAGENPVEESYWVQAAEAADSLGVDVINTSLGYFTYDKPSYSYTYSDLDGQTSFISRGANIAFSKGMVVIVAAGNSGTTVNPFISVPADAPGVLTIGAVNSSEVRASFSSYGPTSDGRIKPDVMAMGVSAVVATPTGSITTVNGTSLSSPIICGLAACLWQALPQLTNSQLVQLIKQSADRYTNPDNFYGYGIPDFAQALLRTDEPQLQGEKVFLYPNPANNYLKIALPEDDSQATITIYNSIGQRVLNTTFSSNEAIDLAQLPQGVYVYDIAAPYNFHGKLLKK